MPWLVCAAGRVLLADKSSTPYPVSLSAVGAFAKSSDMHRNVGVEAIWSAMQAATCAVSKDCTLESLEVASLIVFLLIAIITASCMYFSLRDYQKEEQITPLCPQLVKDTKYEAWLPEEALDTDTWEIRSKGADDCICRALIEWPHRDTSLAHSVAATVVLQTSRGASIATVVARGAFVAGRALALCRPNHEIFGFVIPDSDDPTKFYVNHRTGVTLLVLHGDFQTPDAIGRNPVQSQVCWIRKIGSRISIGLNVPGVDLSLVVCGVLAIRLYQRLHGTKGIPAAVPASESDQGAGEATTSSH